QFPNTDRSANPNTNPNINPIGKRLARMPHIIALPAETPPPSELKRLIEARIAEIESEQLRLDQRDEDQAFEFAANKSILSILELHLAELHHDFPDEDQGSAGCPQPVADGLEASLNPKASGDTNTLADAIRPMRPIVPLLSISPTQLTE